MLIIKKILIQKKLTTQVSKSNFHLSDYLLIIGLPTTQLFMHTLNEPSRRDL